MTREFLPRHNIVKSLGSEQSTGPNARSYFPVPVVDDIPKSLVKRTCCLRRLFPIGLLTFMTVSTFVGFSVLIVPKNSVGFVPCDYPCVNETIKTLSPGVHLVVPWEKRTIRLVYLSPRNLTIGHMESNSNAPTCSVGYRISDTNTFLVSLSSFSSDSVFESVFIAEIKRYLLEREEDRIPPYEAYGLLVDTLKCR